MGDNGIVFAAAVVERLYRSAIMLAFAGLLGLLIGDSRGALIGLVIAFGLLVCISIYVEWKENRS